MHLMFKCIEQSNKLAWIVYSQSANHLIPNSMATLVVAHLWNFLFFVLVHTAYHFVSSVKPPSSLIAPVIYVFLSTLKPFAGLSTKWKRHFLHWYLWFANCNRVLQTLVMWILLASLLFRITLCACTLAKMHECFSYSVSCFTTVCAPNFILLSMLALLYWLNFGFCILTLYVS